MKTEYKKPDWRQIISLHGALQPASDLTGDVEVFVHKHSKEVKFSLTVRESAVTFEQLDMVDSLTKSIARDHMIPLAADLEKNLGMTVKLILLVDPIHIDDLRPDEGC